MSDETKMYFEYYATRGQLKTPLGYAIADILDIQNGIYTVERLEEDVEGWAWPTIIFLLEFKKPLNVYGSLAGP